MHICEFLSFFFFWRKYYQILKSLKEANSLNVCSFLFKQPSPKVPTTFGICWFSALALRAPGIIRLSILLYLSKFCSCL